MFIYVYVYLYALCVYKCKYVYRAHASPFLNLHLRILRSGRLALRALTFVFVVTAAALTIITIRTLYKIEATRISLGFKGLGFRVVHLWHTDAGQESDSHATFLHHGPKIMISWSMWSLCSPTEDANETSDDPGLRFQGCAWEKHRG